jgi:hypothetical protein
MEPLYRVSSTECNNTEFSPSIAVREEIEFLSNIKSKSRYSWCIEIWETDLGRPPRNRRRNASAVDALQHRPVLPLQNTPVGGHDLS